MTVFYIVYAIDIIIFIVWLNAMHMTVFSAIAIGTGDPAQPFPKQ